MGKKISSKKIIGDGRYKHLEGKKPKYEKEYKKVAKLIHKSEKELDKLEF